MSGFAQVSNEALRDGSLSVQSRLLYALLCSYAWGNSAECFTSQKRLSQDMGLKTTDTVKKGVRELEEAGLIFVSKQGKLNRYTIAERVSSPEQGDHSHSEQGDYSNPKKNTHEKNTQEPSAATSSPQPEKVRDPVWDTLLEYFDSPSTPGERADFGKTVKEIKGALAEDDGTFNWNLYAETEIRRRLDPVDEQYRSHRSLRNRWTEMGRKGDPPEEDDSNGRTPDPDMEECLYCAGTGYVHYIDGVARSIEGDSGEPGVTICKDCGGTGEGTY